MATATAATASEFKTLFPAFCDRADSEVEAWFTQAALRFRASRFRTQWHMAVYYFTAHQITLLGAPGASDVASDASARGQVTSEKVGDLSMNYGAAIDAAKVPPGLQPFMSTKYGVQLIGIVMSRSAAHGGVIRTGSSMVGAIQGQYPDTSGET